MRAFPLAPILRTCYWHYHEDYRRLNAEGFWSEPGRRDAEMPLRTWVKVVQAADWSKPNDVKEMFGSADLLADGRVVFDIGGNKYRLVVAVHYRGKRIYIRFIGTHKEYDKIDANKV